LKPPSGIRAPQNDPSRQSPTHLQDSLSWYHPDGVTEGKTIYFERYGVLIAGSRDVPALSRTAETLDNRPLEGSIRRVGVGTRVGVGIGLFRDAMVLTCPFVVAIIRSGIVDGGERIFHGI
jgi:hypothetical protein